ncbi:MAG: response regulator [Polyangiales bacterium]
MKPDEVLAVDDDPTTMAVLRDAITAVGCQASFAEDAMRAWERLQLFERPRVLVVGQAMRGMDGVSLCRALREQAGDQPYVILLAEGTTAGEVAAFRAGADEFIAKPVKAEGLAARVRRALRGPAEVIDASDVSAELTLRLPALVAHSVTIPPPRALTRPSPAAAPRTLPPPPRPVTAPPPRDPASDPFRAFSNPLLLAAEPAPRKHDAPAARPRPRLGLGTAVVLAGACAAGAAVAWRHAPRTPVSSIPPPADASTNTPSVRPLAPPHDAGAEASSSDASTDASADARDASADGGIPAPIERALRLGDLVGAERMLLAAITAQPGEPGLHARLGLVRFRLGRPVGALRAFRAASAIEPRNPSFLRWVARLEETTGDRAGARQTLRSLLALVPGDPAARQALTRLGPGT